MMSALFSILCVITLQSSIFNTNQFAVDISDETVSIKAGFLVTNIVSEGMAVTFFRTNNILTVSSNGVRMMGAQMETVSDFIIPAGVETFTVPTSSTDNWTVRRTPGASLTLTTAGDSETHRNSTQSILFKTGTNYTSNFAYYTLQTGDPPNFFGWDYLIRLKITEGSGLTFWTNLSGISIYLLKDNNNFRSQTLGARNVEYSDDGWYTFAGSTGGPEVNGGWEIFGSCALSEITRVAIQTSKQDTSVSPEVIIDYFAFVRPPQVATLTIQADGSYGSHYEVGALLSSYGMRGTFYVESDGASLTLSEMRVMQQAGHLIAAYVRDFGSQNDLDSLLKTYLKSALWLKENGFTLGTRHIVHGISSRWRPEYYELFIPTLVDTVAFSSSLRLSSQRNPHFQTRYHEFTAATQNTVESLLGEAVKNGARLGLLIHELTGSNLLAFNSFISSKVWPLKRAGRLDVLTVEEAYRKSLAETRPVRLPKLTKAERDTLTGMFDGMRIYQTDNTPGIRIYENGVWQKPTVTADP